MSKLAHPLTALGVVLTMTAAVLCGAFLSVALADDGDGTNFVTAPPLLEDNNKAVRTIMVYMDGASSEAKSPVCSAMLEEYMNAKFDSEKIRIILMTGGSSKWHLDKKYLRDKDGKPTLTEISSEYNQVWEVHGSTDSEEGYLRLLDADGVTGDGDNARKSEDELMSDPNTLQGFINYAKATAPAEKTV